MAGDRGPYVPPPYPYDRLNTLKIHGDAFAGGLVDLSIGTPRDPAPPSAVEALSASGAERGYPPSIGLPEARAASAAWMERCFNVSIEPHQVAATIGTKEFVVSAPHYLHLRRPDLDTVLYPSISYPSYEMGATLAGLRAVPVAVDDQWRIDLDSIDPDDAARALALWVNTPGNPAGALDDLEAAAAWGRTHDTTVLSDECYIEFTWGDVPTGRRRAGRSILEHGTDNVLALHSLSKRSNFAGARFGFYAGDDDLVWYLSELRKHAGNMVPGPVQHAAIAALGDDDHVDHQRAIYHERLVAMAQVMRRAGFEATMPRGGFYLWVEVPGGDAWAAAEWLAVNGGLLVSPGEFYGDAGSAFVRIALVDTLERVNLVAERLDGRRYPA
ncbi:MAG: aminotransferase class I/II-fold pyridoxal phosphate-dependent enzyme [Actinomycetota bacterium]